MRRALPWLLLLLAPLVFFPGVLQGEVISADDHLSVHPVFQEAPGGHVRHPALSDPALQFAALRRQVLDQLRQGEAPLWNPELYGGAPLLADGQSRAGWLGTWARLLLPEDIAQNLESIGILAGLALGVALLMRALGAGLAASLIAGLGALGLPYAQVWLLHPHASTYLLWPWLLLGLERLRAGGSPLGVALAVLGLGLGGHSETAAHGLLLGLAWGALRLRGRAAGLALGAALSGGLLAAPLWLPLAEQLTRSATAQAHGGNALVPAQLLDLIWPGWLGHPAGEGYRGAGVWADGALNPGLAVMALAALSLLLRPLAEGPPAVSGLQGALQTRPGLLLWGGWALALLAALGLRAGPINNARLGAEAALLLVLAAGLGAQRLLERAPRPRAMAVVLGGLVLASGLHARRLDQGTLPAAEHAPAPAPWAQALAARAEDAKVLGLGWVLQPNSGALAGLRDLRGYDLPVSRDTERLMALLNPQLQRPWFPVQSIDARTERLLAFAGVRFVVAEGGVPGLAPVDLGPAPVQVHALDDDAPRAWVASSAWSAPGPQEAAACVLQGRCNRGRPSVEGEALEGPARLERLAVEERGSTRHITLPPREAPGLVVNTESWAPGWTAEVDGQARAVLRVAGAFQGVRVAPGERTLVLRYRPAGWRWGWFLALWGVVGVVVTWRLRLRDMARPSRARGDRGVAPS
ncbi:MAG: YfhO family protein [Alphaproteobacteria bacterium]|nr:YfhO family protein [Alphaproteobacteria bacterium]